MSLEDVMQRLSALEQERSRLADRVHELEQERARDQDMLDFLRKIDIDDLRSDVRGGSPED